MRQFALILLGAITALLASVSVADTETAGVLDDPLVKANVNIHDQVSKQRGAKLFVNYCMGCHSLQYQRYGRLGEDLGIPEDLVLENLNFVSDRIGDTMQNAMDKTDAAEWFGATPPDLTMVARLRSPDWLYSYLIGFYEDASRPYGYNNKIFPLVGMPHVLADLEEELGDETFREAMLDLTNFLVYTAEPVQETRRKIGFGVLFFLLILLIPAYLLKREYWKDVK